MFNRKIRILLGGGGGGGGFMKNQYTGEQEGGLPKKRRGLGQFADLRGLGKKEGRGIYF